MYSKKIPKQSLRLINFLFLSLLTGALQANAQNTEQQETEGPNIFVGDTLRLGVGTSGAGRFHGEISAVLSETEQQSWLSEVWLGPSIGGGKLSHHRLHNEAVHKFFVAHDQNATRDQKTTLGYGQERRNWFGNVNLSVGATGRRLVSEKTVTEISQENGTTPTGTYVDTITQSTQTRLFDRAYNRGVGLRAGRYNETHDLRLSVGLDHERGNGRAKQDTLSLLAEKGFVGTPHSLAFQLSRKNRSGEARIDNTSETQFLLTYRLSLGAVNHRPEKRFLVNAIQSPAQSAVPVRAESTSQVIPTASASVKEQRWVKNKVTVRADALFEFNSSRLTATARTELDRIATVLKQQARDGNIRITGHTCDIGSDSVNDRLSLKRAESVRNYLVSTEAVSMDALMVEGKGEREQKHPATAATRALNRRVELEFFNLTNKAEWVEVPQTIVPAPVPTPSTPESNPASVVYERTLVDQPAAWSQRALRSPAMHKRDVDVYRTKQETKLEKRERENVERPNQAPIAVNDTFRVSGSTPGTLDVLANDVDPDGDPISIISVTQPIAGVGSVVVMGNQLTFTPSYIFGVDTFSYTIKDDRGVTSTANVVLIDP